MKSEIQSQRHCPIHLEEQTAMLWRQPHGKNAGSLWEPWMTPDWWPGRKQGFLTAINSWILHSANNQRTRTRPLKVKPSLISWFQPYETLSRGFSYPMPILLNWRNYKPTYDAILSHSICMICSIAIEN